MAHPILYEHQQELAYVQHEEDRIAHRQVVVGATPPVTEIHTITPQQLHGLRRLQKLTSDAGIPDITFKTEADELRYFAINLGHSRALAAEKLVRICQASFEESSKVPLEQWIALRSTSFPFSALSDEERQAIEDNIAQIVEHALVLGMCVISIYLAIKLLKRMEEERPALIIHSDGGDVAIGSVIDKRSGGTYVDSLEYVGAKVISPDEVESHDVLFEPPPRGYYKAITIVLIPDSDKWFAFPQHLQYLSSNAVQQVAQNLADAETEEEIGRVLHLLGALGPIASPAVDRVDTLLEHPSEVIRNVATDVLADIGGAEVVERLSAVLGSKQQSATVREAAALSLARIGSDEAISELCEQLPSLKSVDLLLRLASSHANETVIRQTIQRTAQRPKHTLLGIVNLFLNVSPAVLIPTLLDELETNSSEEIRVFVIAILLELYVRRVQKDEHWGPRIIEALSQSVLSESARVARTAFFALSQIAKHTDLSEDDIRLPSLALNSLHSDLRSNAVRQLITRADKDGLELAEQAIQQEADSGARKRMITYLMIWRARRSMRTMVEVLLQRFEESWGNVPKLLRVFTGVLLLIGTGVGFLYLSTTLPTANRSLFIALFLVGFVSVFLWVFLLGGAEARIVFSFLLLLLVVIIAIQAIRTRTSGVALPIQDDFETPNYARWELASSSNVWTGYEDGKLTIVVDELGTTSWILMRGSAFRDFDVSVETTIMNGPVDSLYGVLFRYQDVDNFYYFVLSGTGYYALMKQESGEWDTLVACS